MTYLWNKLLFGEEREKRLDKAIVRRKVGQQICSDEVNSNAHFVTVIPATERWNDKWQCKANKEGNKNDPRNHDGGCFGLGHVCTDGFEIKRYK